MRTVKNVGSGSDGKVHVTNSYAVRKTTSSPASWCLGLLYVLVFSFRTCSYGARFCSRNADKGETDSETLTVSNVYTISLNLAPPNIACNEWNINQSQS